MKKFLTYFLCMFLAAFLGAAAMYYVLNYVGTSVDEDGNVKTRIEKSVTVNDNGISDGIDAIYNAVVVVENYQYNKLAGIGSGFIYDKEGYIMTNHHVIEKASELKVVLTSGETVSATLIGSDEFADIAVIQIDKKYVTDIAKIGSSEDAKV
jgi:serine protease Do